MTPETCARQLINECRQRRPMRATSLLMTVYGDTVELHGGSIWLGSLIRLLEPLGINQRLARTSVFRLTKDQWLTAERNGRRSFYRLTDSGLRQFEDADARIYSVTEDRWDGNWQIVILTGNTIPKADRDAVRRELRWQGFGQISPDVFAHPIASLSRVKKMLAEKSLQNSAVLIQGGVIDNGSSNEQAIADLVQTCCDLDEIKKRYEEFIAQFAPMFDALDSGNTLPDPENCFLVRTLLIDSYRRILLKDPRLPAALLPPDWPGDHAREITVKIYRQLSAAATAHVQQICETENGLFANPDESFYRRFGGLPKR